MFNKKHVVRHDDDEPFDSITIGGNDYELSKKQSERLEKIRVCYPKLARFITPFLHDMKVNDREYCKVTRNGHSKDSEDPYRKFVGSFVEICSSAIIITGDAWVVGHYFMGHGQIVRFIRENRRLLLDNEFVKDNCQGCEMFSFFVIERPMELVLTNIFRDVANIDKDVNGDPLRVP